MRSNRKKSFLHYLSPSIRIKGKQIIMELNILSGKIIGIAMKVHSQLGPGLLESSYKNVLFHKMQETGLWVEKEKPVPLISEGIKLKCGYRLDLLVENTIVVEVKSVNVLHPIHRAQVLTYLKTGGFPLGLLINFNVLHLRDGIKRIIL